MTTSRERRLFNEKSIRLFLAAYRGFALVVAAALLSFNGFENFYWPQWTISGIATGYTLFKIATPLYKSSNRILRGIDFSSDLVICLLLPIFTGGFNSPFLLYMLSPVLRSSLLHSKKLTFSVVLLPILAIVAREMIVYGVSPVSLFASSQLLLGLVGVYLVSSLLFAWLPYAMNLNTSQDMMTQGIIEERKRLSRQVHDGVSQTLWIIRWKLEQLAKRIASGDSYQALNELTDVLQKVEGSQREIKEFIVQLRSNALDTNQGFVPSLARYTTDFTREYGIDCQLSLADGKLDLPSLTEMELLYIAQEALSNVRKHATASAVRVAFESKNGGVEMIIRDNGRGFDPLALSGGHGLAVMAERVRSIGGKLLISSQPGKGTEIKVNLTHIESV